LPLDKCSIFGSYLRLTRPANLLTAISDIWAGIALSGLVTGPRLPTGQLAAVVLLSLSAACLYGGGVVLNDVFDAELDSRERPERPIPSGKVSKTGAAVLGIALLMAGILLAAWQSTLSMGLALLIAVAAVTYDRWGKHQSFLGPVNMGLCRGLDVLLGMSILPGGLPLFGWVAVVPVIYIAAITLISRGEVHGGRRSSLITALICYLIVMAAVVCVGLLKHQLAITLIFLLLFAVMVLPSTMNALGDPSAPRIGRAVKTGVLALILLNACWVAAGAGLLWAMVTALLLPLSLWMARHFAVT
jgi:4-hydroxybenzoate polyprenyltransferase